MRLCVFLLVDAVSEGAEGPVANDGDSRHGSEEEHLASKSQSVPNHVHVA